MKRRRYPKGWNTLDQAWKAIDLVPSQKANIKFARKGSSVRNRAIVRYIYTGESEAIEQI